MGKRVSWALVLRLLGFSGIIFLFVSAFTALPNVLNRGTGSVPRLEAADAIVVLAAGVDQDGMLSGSSLRRTVEGIRLYRKGLAPLLVFLGPVHDERTVEAQTRAELASEIGIPLAVVLTESRALTTREEAQRMRTLLAPRGVRRILLVTDSIHMRRAGPLFERAGFEVLPAPADEFSAFASQPQERLRLMRWVLQELLARLYYRAAGYL